MKAKLLLIVMLFVLAVSVNAQTKAASTDAKTFKIGAGAMIGLPTGDYTDVASLAYGVDVMGENAVAPSLGLTLSLGYFDFAKKSDFKEVEDEFGYNLKLGLITVLAGAKYYFSDKLYGSTQIGYSFGTESDSGSAFMFTFAPGIGYKIADKLDLLLKYQSASKVGSSVSFLGLRAGYSF